MVKVELIERVNLGEKAYEILKNKITNGELKPGERVSDDKLASSFGISRTPVREALTKLSGEGLVDIVPHGGIYVKKLNKKDIEEIYTIREVLEGLAARLAASSSNVSIIKQMKEACQDYEKGIQKKDVNLCINSDLVFHQLIAKSTGNKKLIEILERFHIQIISIMQKGPNYWINAPTYLQEHLAIVDSISRGKEDLAEEVMRKHIREGKKKILKYRIRGRLK